ncbi:hypothetical protein EJB05_41972, partial [Eragrostis curvula]
MTTSAQDTCRVHTQSSSHPLALVPSSGRSAMARSHGLGLVCFALLVAAASATQFRVGGQKGWSVPDANAESYNGWAGRMRFQIGDQLLFAYPKETDSVLLVEPAAYNACNTSSYDNKFDDGNTVFTFDRSGPFFFISGNEANCRANEKLIIVVLADRSGARTPPAPSTMPPPSSAPLPSPPSLPPTAAPMPSPASATPPSAAPFPAPAGAPTTAPSPTTGSAPASAPTTTPSSPPPPGGQAPSPSTPGGAPQPPSGSANAPGAAGGSTTTPTPPSGNDQSGASTVVAGIVGSLGAYFGYAMLAI